MGVNMGWGGAQLKQHTGPLQLASCSVLVAPVGKPSQSPAGPVSILCDTIQLMCRYLCHVM